MSHKIKEYELPQDNQPSTVGESSAAMQQYAEDLRYSMQVLSSVSPEKLHHIVVLLADYNQENVMTMDEINSRIDEAERQIEAGEVIPGDVVHQQMLDFINSYPL